MSRASRFIAVFAAAVLLGPVVATAQSTGRVVGVVQDSSGAVVPAVEVQAIDPLRPLVSIASRPRMVG